MERPTLKARSHVRPPLRTYSKRAILHDENEPSTKKRRLGNRVVDVENKENTLSRRRDSLIDLPVQNPSQVQSKSPPSSSSRPPKKSTILSYFKVRSPNSIPTSACAHSSDSVTVSSDAIHPTSAPPSSPPCLKAPSKKPRRLTTKPLRGTDSSTTDSESDDEKKVDPDLPDTMVVAKSVLQETGPAALTRTRGKEPDQVDTSKRGCGKRQKSKPATVQTTISLSLSEKQFIECTACNMLYNPYHEKDVKVHARRHNALVKSRKDGK